MDMSGDDMFLRSHNLRLQSSLADKMRGKGPLPPPLPAKSPPTVDAPEVVSQNTAVLTFLKNSVLIDPARTKLAVIFQNKTIVWFRFKNKQN